MEGELLTASVAADVAARMARAVAEAEGIAKLEDDLDAAFDLFENEDEPCGRTAAAPLYLPSGTTYTFSDLVTWRGKRPGDKLTPERARRRSRTTLRGSSRRGAPNNIQRE